MVRRAPFAALLAFTLVLPACTHTPPPPPEPALDAPADIAAISSARDAFAKAYNAGDAEAIGKLYTVNAVSEPNHQSTLIGRDAIVSTLKTMFEQVTVKVEFTSAETKTSGNAGFDRGQYKVDVTPKAGGPSTTVEGRYFVLYFKQKDGAWLVARDFDNSAVPLTAPTPAAPAAEAPTAK
jgi:uncharacterized protein (TIGR02246 family)